MSDTLEMELTEDEWNRILTALTTRTNQLERRGRPDLAAEHEELARRIARELTGEREGQ